VKHLVWLTDEVSTPPFTPGAGATAGELIRLLRLGEHLGMPDSRPMPVIGQACHELRIPDLDRDRRILYHIGQDAIVVLGVEKKSRQRTPNRIVEMCRRRLRAYFHHRSAGGPIS